MLEAIHSFDWAILSFVEKLWEIPGLTQIMTFITHLGDSGKIWILIALILVFTKKYRKAGFAMFIALIGSLLINDFFLKDLVSRPRPYNYTEWIGTYNWPEFINKESSFSFPSGHTTSSIGAAVALFQYNKKKLGIPLLILAVLIALSRIYVHVHYPTDVLAGIVEGILLGLGGAFIVNKVSEKFGQWWAKRKKDKEPVSVAAGESEE